MSRTAQLDAQNEEAVNAHLEQVATTAGGIDISFNAVGEDTSDFGIPMTELSLDAFMRPISVLTTTHYLTALAAARHMQQRERGVILTLSSSVARMPDAMAGGLYFAYVGIEAWTRQLAVEVGRSNVRVVCLRPDGILESARMGSVTREVWRRAVEREGQTIDDYLDSDDGRHLLPHSVTLDEVANMAVFIASDRASAMTGTVINISCGAVLD